MIKDNVIEDIIKRVTKKVNDKFKLKLTEESVFNIADSQFRRIPISMEKFEEVKLNYIGRFSVKKGRKDAINTVKEISNNQSIPDELKESIINARGKVHNKSVTPRPTYKHLTTILDFRTKKEDEII